MDEVESKDCGRLQYPTSACHPRWNNREREVGSITGTSIRQNALNNLHDFLTSHETQSRCGKWRGWAQRAPT